MTHQPAFSVGMLFDEVDETGVLHHYWILATAKLLRNSVEGRVDNSRQVLLEGSLATAAAVAHPGQRITWDASVFQPALTVQP